MENISLSKIVPNVTETSWSQAYTTHNLYLLLALNKNGISGIKIALEGKHILERIQREFYALEEKKLSNIKAAVERSIFGTDAGFSCSVILLSISSDVANIVIANKGQVFIKRGDKFGTVAKGEEEEILSFSGKIQSNDVLILSTESFVQKVTPSYLRQSLEESNIFDSAEKLTPKIHENGTGTEAAIFLHLEGEKIKKLESRDSPQNNVEIPQETLYKTNKKLTFFQNILSHIKIGPNILYFIKKSANKKIIIPIIIIILGSVLFLSVFLEKNNESQKKQEQHLKNVLIPAQKKYDEALALATLNKQSAVQSLNEAKALLTKERDTLLNDSKGKKKLDKLLDLINQKLQELDNKSTIKNLQAILSTSTSSDIKTIGAITSKSDQIIVADQESGTLFFPSDKSVKKIDVSEIHFITADEKFIYIITKDKLIKIDKKSDKSQKFELDDISSIVGVDTFLGNIYTATTKGNTIDKYTPSDFEKSSYLVAKQLFEKPISLSIDGSIWILVEKDNNAVLKKFTKGKENEFILKGFSKPFDKEATIYTESDYANVYILNKTSRNLVIVNKSGEYQTTYDLKNLKDISYLAVDEKNKKVYVASKTTLYSFDL